MHQRMKIDGPLFSTSLADVRPLAARQQEAGFDGLFTFDGPYDPFSPLAAIATPDGPDLSTGVAIAFARNPMTVAQVAHDLQTVTKGRFQLGLGSQIRPHVEHRFGMPWGKPVARMKEFIAALRAIFAAWDEGAPLRFEGQFYSHTLMPPMMKQRPSGHRAPPILLAGVGEAMLKAAGEVADGYVVHPFHSLRYLETVARPALEAGRAAAGKAGLDGFDTVVQVLCVTGADERELAATREAVRHQIAFYASTPAYVPVLAAEGLEAIHAELRAMTKRGAWLEMASLVSDDALARFAVIGTPEEVGRALVARYGATASRVAVGTPVPLSLDASRRLVAAVRSR